MSELIEFDEKQQVFHLHNQEISYIFSVVKGGTLSHLYFGKRVRGYHGELAYPAVDRGFSGNLPGDLDRTFSRDTLPKEYSGAGENGLSLTSDHCPPSQRVKRGLPALRRL